MRSSRVRQKWREGKRAACTCVHMTDASVCEMVGLMGFDCIWIDLEHHPYSTETAGHMIRAARVGGADVLARPAKGEFMRMARLLEAGAHGILYPRCESADEAREVVRWAKFAPLGERGADGGNSDMPFLSMSLAEYVRVANEETFIAVQIESPHAVAHCREIAAVDGVDMLFFGPGDYSVLAGIPGQVQSEQVRKATEEVCKIALSEGKQFGTPCMGPEHIQWLVEIGATFLTYGSDIRLLKSGFENIRQTLEHAGCDFKNRLG